MTTHTLDSPASGEPDQPFALRTVRSFRHWRKGRPFPAGLLIVLAGIELWLAPFSSIGTIIHEGVGGVSAFFIGALMMMFGLTVWFTPSYRVFAGIASILLGLIALPATNLGGFFIGTLLSLIGGGLAVAWTPRPGWEAQTRRQRRSHATDENALEPSEAEQSALFNEESQYEREFTAYDGGDEPTAAAGDQFPAAHDGEDTSARPQD